MHQFKPEVMLDTAARAAVGIFNMYNVCVVSGSQKAFSLLRTTIRYIERM